MSKRQWLIDRLEVLETCEHNLLARKLATETPQNVLCHVARLREAAAALVAEADRIELSLAIDCESVPRINAELYMVRAETMILNHFLRIKVYPDAETVRRMLRMIASEFQSAMLSELMDDLNK